jgi:hypothetical protein
VFKRLLDKFLNKLNIELPSLKPLLDNIDKRITEDYGYEIGRNNPKIM